MVDVVVFDDVVVAVDLYGRLRRVMDLVVRDSVPHPTSQIPPWVVR